MFPDTQWTELAHASLHGNTLGREALEQLCRAYWEPVRQCIVQRGWAAADAQDLTQDFFVFVMEKGVLHRVERERGKFRCFLQGVLHNFLRDERDHRHAAKRGGGMEPSELDVAALAAPEHDNSSAIFDRAWARALMKTALQLVANECRAKRGDSAFDTLSVFLGAEGKPMTYEDAAARLSLGLGAFKSEVMLWRGKLRDYLRSEVRKTVSAPHEVEEELGYMRQLLST
ncbi:MAG: hypothetical protein NTV80_10585 [Verrucomicrobia bacterium]|nr:hypothetical protein [Verrucomicrobiota bacterium]